jgi:hypothetical protein
MLKKIVGFDTIIRLIGSLSLVLGVLFTITGLENRTASTFFVWLALVAGFAALTGSFLGKRSWYSGTIILVTAYLFMISGFSPNGFPRIMMTIVALVVGLGGLSDHFINRNYKKSLFN